MSAAARYNRCLLVKIFVVLAAVMGVTLGGEALLENALNSEMAFAQGAHRFDSLEDFKAYMETPVSYDAVSAADTTVTVSPSDLFDEELLDQDGNVLLRYSHRNSAVMRINFGNAADGYLPIMAYTSDQLTRHKEIMQRVVVPAFLLLLAGEAAGACILYRKKRQK